jgi:hypothetical protein
MRFVTKNIHRAFPQLDSFSDEQCRLYVRRAQSGLLYRVLQVSISMLMLLALVSALPLALALSGVIMNRFDPSALAVSVAGACLLAALSLPVLAVLHLRDRMLWRLLSRQIGKARCLRCSYSLLGQRLVDGVITCPECGQTTTLSDLGLRSEADLIPRQTV